MRFGTIVLATLVALSIPNPVNAWSHGGGRGGSAPRAPHYNPPQPPHISQAAQPHFNQSNASRSNQFVFPEYQPAKRTVRLPIASELESHDQFETR